MTVNKNNFEHLIFTNFGVGIYDISWLAYRLEVFRMTVFQSINNQCNKNFTWFIFIHEDMPNVIKIQIESLLRTSKCEINLVEVDSYFNISKKIDNIKGSYSTGRLITSRIDDDDLIVSNIVDIIQRLAIDKPDKELVIALKSGAEYLPIDGVAMSKDYESIALMLTMVSFKKGNSFKSVNEYAHHLIVATLSSHGESFEYIPLTSTDPLFLYVKHPLSDSFYAGARARIIKSDDSFLVDQEFMRKFGQLENQFKELSFLLSDIPNGMPYKYMEQLNNLRKKVVNGDLTAQGRIEKLANKATRKRTWIKTKEKKIKVAILGSSVTRDLFDLIDELNEKFEVCFYCARSSVVSYMSPPCTDERLSIESTGFENVLAQYDLSKTHWDALELSNPDFILIDFIDERIGLIEHNNTWLTASGPIIRSFQNIGEESEVVRPWSPHVSNVRRWALNAFMGKALSISENVILHKASWSVTSLDSERNVVDTEARWDTLVKLNNGILEAMFDAVEEDFPFVDVIGGRDTGMVAGGDHKWDYSPFHYDKAYYKSLAGQLLYRIY